MRRFALAGLLAGLLAGCQLSGDDSATTQDTTTTTGGTVTARADERAAEAQAPQVRAILQDLWDQFDLPDKASLDDKPGDGRLRACTLDTMTHITSWAEQAQLRVSQEENPELEAHQAERVRVWLDDNGWERIDNPAPASDPVTYHRNDDGFFVTVTPWGDARVDLDVESPCFNDQGQRVVGTTSRADR